MSRHIALLMAAGKSARMAAVTPKQFMTVDGESILLHTMQTFQAHSLIDDIYIICSHEWEIAVSEEARNSGITKFRGCITGGETAYQSLSNGINALLNTPSQSLDDIVLVHDAVRPLVTPDTISRNIAVCLTHGNAISVIGSHEAIAISEDGNKSSSFIPREKLFRAQTPHTFPLRTLKEIISQAKAVGIEDSQSLFTIANEVGISPLHLAQGDILNFKITYPSDIQIYQALKNLNK